MLKHSVSITNTFNFVNTLFLYFYKNFYKNRTDYMDILETYFENDCSAVHTARALYCHKNTLAYKLDKIKKVLGYDILKNDSHRICVYP